MERRRFLRVVASWSTFGGLTLFPFGRSLAAEEGEKQDPVEHLFGMGVAVDRCIGCGTCISACKAENQIPIDSLYYRTWVERYMIKKDDSVIVRNIDTERYVESSAEHTERDTLRTFFVPKLCNQCEKPPCVQVCPVGATFKTVEGVILVDATRCIGCRYCVQACPYGARFIHPVRKTADKCTFCYHRVVKGSLPACVEVCPTQARVFGDLESPSSPLTRFRRTFKLHVLKPYLNTEPKVLYASLDGEVR